MERSPSTIAERITLLRKRAGLSQEALARQMERSLKTVSRYETGLLRPSRENLQRLATILNADPAWIEFGTIARTTTYERTEYEMPLSDDPVFLAFLETETGKRMTDEEKQLMSEVTRFRGPPQSIEAYAHVLSAVRLGFPPAAIADAQERSEKHLANHVAKGGKVVDRKAVAQKYATKRKLNDR
jgi:transcriptional regulator with XRE-family HTH domain